MSKKFRYGGKKYSMQGFATGQYASVYKGFVRRLKEISTVWYNKKVTAYGRKKK